MYRERKSRTPAKTVTHFLISCIKENGPVPATNYITEPVNTWAGWKAAGYMVEHGAKALFQAVLIHSSRGDGQTYRASFFGASQVQPLEAQ